MKPQEPRPSQNIGMLFASAGAWSATGKVISKLFDLATLIILSNILEPADFGLVAKAMVLITVVEAVTALPIEAPILRLTNPGKEVYHTAFTLTLIRAITIFLVVAGLSNPIAFYFQDPRLVPLLLALASAPILRGCVSPLMSEYVRTYNMRPEFIMDIASKLGSLILGSTLAALTKSYWAIAASTIATAAILAALSYWFAPYRPKLSLKRWKNFSDVVQWNTISQIFETLSWQIDLMLLGRLLDVKVFGLYSMSRTLTIIPEQAIVMPVRRPMLTAFAAAEDHDRRNELWLLFSSGTLVCVGPLLIILAMRSNEAVHTVLGPGWEGAAVFVSGMALAFLPNLPTVPLNPLAISIYKTKLVTFRLGMELAASVPLITLAVFMYGSYGAIVARGLIEMGMAALVFSIVRSQTGLSLTAQLSELWRPVTSLAFLALCLFLTNGTNQEAAENGRLNTAFELVGTALLGLIGYFTVLLALWILSGRPKSIEHHLVALFCRIAKNR